MLISSSKNFIFYHVYKVAGTSVRRELLPYSSKKQIFAQNAIHALSVLGIQFPHAPIYDFHPTLSDVKLFLGDDFDKYFRFCFVRSPLDWQKSLYYFAKENTRHHQHKLIKNLTFEDYLLWRMDSDFKLQSDLIYEGNTCLVDKIGKFENIDQDFDDICTKLNIPFNLQHLNKAGAGKHTIPLSSRTLDRFKSKFEPDYTRLGYDIDNVALED